MPEGGLNLRWPEEPFPKLEERLTRWKIPAALAWARANRLDRNVFGVANGEPARLGIVSTGKAWLDVMQALTDLGIDDATAKSIGIRVYKVAMPWPLEPEGMLEFCSGCDEVLVIEEKRSLIEAQLKEILYPLAHRPRVTGKIDEGGAPLLPEWGELSPSACARVIVSRLRRVADSGIKAGVAPLATVLTRCEERLALLAAKEQLELARMPPVERIPYFCSGCPHNTSTRVPEGSRAVAGIGCSYMAMWMDRGTATFTHMGGEGATWVGQAPFTETRHVFQNIGDGTYFHSGSLAIRQAVATRTPITYKILFNDAVAMTGGQQHDGQLTPAIIARQVAAEGVEKIVVVTDDPDKYPGGYFDASILVHHRGKLDEVQRELREYPGVSVLIYDQICAAEKRRRGKRSAPAAAQKRVFINEAVCENCGDCTVKSNCVSVVPVETEFGRKRAINQSSCNTDYSCLGGFCPSFVSVKGGKLRSGRSAPTQLAAPVAGNEGVQRTEELAKAQAAASMAPGLPDPELPRIDGAYSLLVTGIGGTGVITIGHLLGMAAHLEGKGVTVLDMTGLAQKNGAVMSFVRFASPGSPLFSPRIGIASADAVLGCDLVVTAGREALARMAPGRTRVVANVAPTPTADFTRNADWQIPVKTMELAIVAATGDAEAGAFIDGTRLATALMGDAIATNLFMLGFAWQRGLIPVSSGAIDRAIELNAIAVESNRAAFAWGRMAAVDRERVEKAATPVAAIKIVRKGTVTLGELVEQRRDFLTSYQNARYAKRYTDFVAKVHEAERRVVGDSSSKLTKAVATYFAKLMAYKDEYEVARLYTDDGFLKKLDQQFEGDLSLSFHLAPPLFAKRDANGHLVKREYGSWVFSAFRVLARLRGLRGTSFDIFGYTEERRGDRALIDDYESTIGGLLGKLDRHNLALAIEIASIPDKIRGFGHVRAESLSAAMAHRDQLLRAFESAPSLLKAA